MRLKIRKIGSEMEFFKTFFPSHPEHARKFLEWVKKSKPHIRTWKTFAKYQGISKSIYFYIKHRAMELGMVKKVNDRLEISRDFATIMRTYAELYESFLEK